ncbi:MAG: YheU family protein [Pseudomonadales bacterium]|nr:YheU family protein [Pseudomonadales bacterium]
MRIPPEALAPETLRNLVEEYVTREGTDYGERLYTLDDKVAQVLRQLAAGKVLLLYDPHTSTCQLEARERVPRHLLDESLPDEGQ